MRIEDKNDEDDGNDGIQSYEESTEVSHRPLPLKYQSKWKDDVDALKVRQSINKNIVVETSELQKSKKKKIHAPKASPPNKSRRTFAISIDEDDEESS